MRLDEWCYDCKEYDKERHCCPRFNRVIRTTLDDVRKDAYKHGVSKGIKKGRAMARSQPQKVKWIKKMKVTKTDAYTSYDPEWYCPKCGTKYDPIFAQRVKFCYVCGADIMGEQG